MIRVLVVDDHPLLRAGLHVILEAESDIEVVGEAGDGKEALRVLEATPVDLVLLDIQMASMDGLEVVRRLAAMGLDGVHVLVLTTFDFDEYIHEALQLGVRGFILKSVTPADLVAAVRTVAAGQAFLEPSVARKVVDRLSGRRGEPGPEPPPSPELASLTRRELDVLRCLARGLSNKEIAAALDIGQATVRTHVGHLLTKLHLRDRTQAAIHAHARGLTAGGEATSV